MTKKKLIILMLILITCLLISANEKQINSTEKITDAARIHWDSLSADDKWQSFKIAYNSYLDLTLLYQNALGRIDLLIYDIEQSNKMLTKIWHPSFGFSVNVLVGLDTELKPDVYTYLVFHKYFFQGRFVINIGGGVKIYQTIGGCILFGTTFNF